jgi:hypothetical protein
VALAYRLNLNPLHKPDGGFGEKAALSAGHPKILALALIALLIDHDDDD